MPAARIVRTMRGDLRAIRAVVNALLGGGASLIEFALSYAPTLIVENLVFPFALNLRVHISRARRVAGVGDAIYFLFEFHGGIPHAFAFTDQSRRNAILQFERAWFVAVFV